MCYIPCQNAVTAFTATRAGVSKTYEACAEHGTEANHVTNCAIRAMVLATNGWKIRWESAFVALPAGQAQKQLFEQGLIRAAEAAQPKPRPELAQSGN